MKFLGICGVINQIIDEQTETEIGYRLLDSYWGKGYGTEAVKGCAKYAKEKLKKESIISLIRSENLASIRVAEKNGFKFEKESLFQELPHQVYRLQL
jgi:RimJ/RimL family protein N-acetyltransferase